MTDFIFKGLDMNYYVNLHNLVSTVSYLKEDLTSINYGGVYNTELETLDLIRNKAKASGSSIIKITYNRKRNELLLIPSNNSSKSFTIDLTKLDPLVIEKFLYLIERADRSVSTRYFNRPIRFGLPIVVRNDYGNLKVV